MLPYYLQLIGSCKYFIKYYMKISRYFINTEICRDRIRTTNNMLGDCYAAAIVEELSKKELMALDAAIPYQVKYNHPKA